MMAEYSKSRSSAKSARDEKPQKRMCVQPLAPERELPPDLHPERARLIRVNDRKWANGTVLRYYFFDRPTDGAHGAWVGPAAQKDAVRDAFGKWKALDIGLEFREVSDREEAEVRIGFDQTDGSWSYIGRDVIDVARDPGERTMNFGWDLTTPYGHDTALHEIGHTLGCPHEHQNPNSGIVWNEAAVLDYFRGPPNNWTDDMIRSNILNKLSEAAVSGSAWDPNSIMHYEFEAGLIREPARYAGGLFPQPGLSPKDIEFVRQFYPPLEPAVDRELKPFESQRLMIAAGEQANFRMRPRFTRNYTIQTFGTSDTVVVLFEDVDGDISFVAGDDDSGFDRNARITTRLYRDHDYVVRVRLYYSNLAGETALMLY